MLALEINANEVDANGFAPGRVQECDNGDDCRTCQTLGWILCNHAGAQIELDLNNADGHYEWCTRCDAPADDLKTWYWCPNRKN